VYPIGFDCTPGDPRSAAAASAAVGFLNNVCATDEGRDTVRSLLKARAAAPGGGGPRSGAVDADRQTRAPPDAERRLEAVAARLAELICWQEVPQPRQVSVREGGGRTDRRGIDRHLGGRTDRQTDRQMDGCTEKSTHR
jgi:hypothetical protein